MSEEHLEFNDNVPQKSTSKVNLFQTKPSNNHLFDDSDGDDDTTIIKCHEPIHNAQTSLNHVDIHRDLEADINAFKQHQLTKINKLSEENQQQFDLLQKNKHSDLSLSITPGMHAHDTVNNQNSFDTREISGIFDHFYQNNSQIKPSQQEPQHKHTFSIDKQKQKTTTRKLLFDDDSDDSGDSDDNNDSDNSNDNDESDKKDHFDNIDKHPDITDIADNDSNYINNDTEHKVLVHDNAFTDKSKTILLFDEESIDENDKTHINSPKSNLLQSSEQQDCCVTQNTEHGGSINNLDNQKDKKTLFSSLLNEDNDQTEELFTFSSTNDDSLKNTSFLDNTLFDSDEQQNTKTNVNDSFEFFDFDEYIKKNENKEN